MMQPIKSVIFDFGGVLTLAPGPEHWNDLVAAIGGKNGSSRLAALMVGYQAHRGGFDRGELSAGAYWTKILEQLGAQVEKGLLARLFELDTAAWTQIRLEVLQWASGLRAAGIGTGILSNMPTEVLQTVEERMDWVAEFRPQVYSCRLGLIKPEPAIYRALLAELAFPPQEVLFLDDRDENVRAARELGLQAERFESLQQILPIARERYALPGPEATARTLKGAGS
jgi:putative hydrolase of the HAD superfamily